MAELNETAVTENKMDWVDDGIPELQENPAENEVVELVQPRVKVDIERYDELIRKEAQLEALIAIAFRSAQLNKENIAIGFDVFECIIGKKIRSEKENVKNE